MRKFAQALNQLSENVSLIHPPRGTLLVFFVALLLVLFFIMVVTVNVFVIFSIPMLFFWFFFYGYYVKVWSAFGYSKLLLFLTTALVAALGILFGGPVRSFAFRIIQQIL